MMTLPPEVEYPMEPCEWGLFAVEKWCFWFLHDWRYLDFQTSHFATLNSSKLCELGQVEVELNRFIFTDFK